MCAKIPVLRKMIPMSMRAMPLHFAEAVSEEDVHIHSPVSIMGNFCICYDLWIISVLL